MLGLRRQSPYERRKENEVKEKKCEATYFTEINRTLSLVVFYWLHVGFVCMKITKEKQKGKAIYIHVVTSWVQFTRKVDPMRHIWPPFFENTMRG